MATKGIPDPEYILRADGHPITSIHLQSFSPGCDLLISGTQSGKDYFKFVFKISNVF